MEEILARERGPSRRTMCGMDRNECIKRIECEQEESINRNTVT